ncbi:TonB-dependent receptor domain-containing protein [Flavobacterium sp. GCM10027622]|uniref:TonB-dependent receptor domain-containing protein n=1 Tax=unclassified Flavobacterium TaxID=196869 RepID=UPI00361161A2
MKFIQKASFLLILFSITSGFGQQKQEGKKIILTGKVIEKSTSSPLDYATVTIIGFNSNQVVSGGLTDANGEFKIEIRPGKFNIKVEFMSFKTYELKEKSIFEDTNLGTIPLQEDAKMIDEVVIRAERTSVDIKLDKKVYTVGKDIMVRGGTVSDILDNIPSVSVDAEGTVALRGNESVRILIDGKPSNMGNINDALKLIPAETIDKVEVVTSPSARYDAEGGGGILNIILKKGKNQGINGTFVVSAGEPKNSGISANLNFKEKSANFFTTIGYNDRSNPGSTKIDQTNFNQNEFIRERRDNNRFGKGLNANFGIELLLDKSTSWTNSLNFRSNKGGNIENVFYYKYDLNKQYLETTKRFNDLNSSNENVEYASNFIKNFKKDGHKLTADISISYNNDGDNSIIDGTKIDDNSYISSERTRKNDKQQRNLFQLDYVLPIGKKSRFEAGFRGNYVKSISDYQVQEKGDSPDNPYTDVVDFTNTFQYNENVTAAYTQYGSKINKFSFLFGLRYEESKIDINQLTDNISKTKKYDNWFPSAFLTYEINDNSSIALNYSKRIARPRDRFINPFTSYTSSVNLFKGNPDINPAFTDAYDIGYLKRWDKLTLNTSLYYNHTTDSFEQVRKETGILIDGMPQIETTFFNLGENKRIGFEFTLNYNFKKWWKLNGNFNFFNTANSGSYTYTNINNQEVTQDFNRKTNTWSSRITSKITLPYKIDWQTNLTYNGQQKTGQSTNKGIGAANVAFSKDILKDMGTISFNVNDVFNSRKRIQDTELPSVISHSEMQWRKRSVTFSFTYRFNKKKTEREQKPRQGGNGNGDDEFIGG